MKLKKLTIKNIASIENATIDFSSKIFEGQETFLICGPTGSGKTTILDCICLALFNTTPRIEASTNEKIDKDGNPEIKLRNVNHLIRENAVNAEVTLSFEGFDSKEYLACWRRYRTHQFNRGKETKEFQKKSIEEKLREKLIEEWTLTTPDKKVYKGLTEVKVQIQEAIKMDFEQFCKTTMLAQGDFTKFLKSSSDDKAGIMEKLIKGTKYSDVGKIINEKTNQKNREIDRINFEISAYPVLEETETKEIEEKIISLQNEIKAADEGKLNAGNKQKWLNDYNKATEQRTNADEALNTANTALEDDTVKKLRAQIALWDKTEQVRQAIKQESKCEQSSKDNELNKARLASEYDIAVAAEKFLLDAKENLVREDAALAEKISVQEPYRNMFEKAEIICANARSIKSNEQSISASTEKVDEYDKEIASLSEQIDSQKKNREKCQKLIEERSNQAAELGKSLSELGAETIDKDVAALNSLKLSVVRAENALTNLGTAQKEYDGTKKSLEEAVGAIDNLAKKEKETQNVLNLANGAAKTSKEAYENAREKISDHAKALRTRLHIGDTCPVCGNIVDEVLNEEELLKFIKPLEDQAASDAKKVQEATTSHSQALADLNAGNANVAKLSKDCEKAGQKVKEAENVAVNACKAVGIEDLSTAQPALDQIKESNKVEEEALNSRRTKISQTRKDIENCNKQMADIRKNSIEPLEKKINETNAKVEKAKQDQSKLRGSMEEAKNAIDRMKEEIEKLKNADWKPEGEGDYYEELSKAAKNYAQAQNDRTRIQHAVSSKEQDLMIIAEAKKAVMVMFPQWADRLSLSPQEHQKATSLWTKLQANCNALLQAIKSNEAEKQAAQETVSRFTTDNPEIKIEEVSLLTTVADWEIAQHRQRLSQLDNAKIQATTLLKSAEKALAELPKSPLSENDSEESLAAQIKNFEEFISSSNQSIGDLKNKLNTNEENLRKRGDKENERKKLTEEYAQWKQLDQYLGSTGGKNFRNVAMGFILSDLLDKANAYLANITGRYTLFCNPGNLSIMMRDSYQGDVVRPTNTLSGGESFIISLALALGLSSMHSADFEVDTLFIDEGFGTLSEEYIEPVISALKRLYQNYGRRVGIISHVEVLKNIPVKIELERENGYTSKLEIRVD